MDFQAIPAGKARRRQKAEVRGFDSNRLLAEHRLRPTLARIYILELFREGHAFTPEQVYRGLVQRGEDVSLATTYRALAQFVDAGLLSRQQLDNGPGRYFLPQSMPNESMLCTECGVLLSLPGPDIAAVLRQLAAKHGYLLTEYELALQGRCLSCRKREG
jgi:Fur family ferric uptake transcriptional regulator